MAVDPQKVADRAAWRGVGLRGSVVWCSGAVPMNRLQRSPLHGSVFALALIAIALSISLLIRPYLEPVTLLLSLVAVWLSALIAWVTRAWRKSRGLLAST